MQKDGKLMILQNFGKTIYASVIKLLAFKDKHIILVLS